MSATDEPQIDALLRSVLVCPVCRGELVDLSNGLGCRSCRLIYPVVEGRPWMLPARAKKWHDPDADP
jgi:uncharacterized protein YbaR (Trm112 family)